MKTKPAKEQNYNFPAETGDGSIFIDGNKVIYQINQSATPSEVNIYDLQYAYLITRNSMASLFLFDFHQHYIPANLKGFEAVYRSLSAKLGFNDVQFFENVFTKEAIKKEIWRKKIKANYRILDDSYNDYQVGFEIQSAEKDFINWDTTYEGLVNNPNVLFEKSAYGQNLLKFKHPVRIGNLLLTELFTYFDNDRKDVPIIDFYTNCYDSSNTDISYIELKRLLQKDFPLQQQKLEYERADQKHFSFDANGVKISLVYTYDNGWQFDGGNTLVLIKNQREYPELLINKHYEDMIEVSDVLLIDENIKVYADYKRNKKVKRRPPKLAQTPQPLIWVDRKNNCIGFADTKFCQVFDFKEVESLTIQNVLPAKGSGGAYLEINSGDIKYVVASGKCHAFDNYKDKLEALLGLKVDKAPEYYDC
ncbi:hypothetical protein V6R21_15600 [Limibacter armeniacum]|uniref:hypothetical protein n=1 Tax=Limibacter armeniacum TaxID=466084 RepID=UPI002FE525D0